MGRLSWLALLPILLLAPRVQAAAEFRLWHWVDGEAIPVTQLEPASGVGNPVLGVLVSLVDQDLYGRVSQSRLRRAAQESGDEKIPWQYLLWVRRAAVPGRGHPEITVRLLSELRLPIPYAVLSYHPGSVEASRLLVLDEWRLGEWNMRWREDDEERSLRVEDLALFALRDGSLGIDVDAWVDWVMGAKLDDMRIAGMALFRHEGKRYAMAFGYNGDGEGRTGVLDLGADKILFPPPTEFRTLGRRLRAEVEARLARESRGSSAHRTP
jgi:hypothetical protein